MIICCNRLFGIFLRAIPCILSKKAMLQKKVVKIIGTIIFFLLTIFVIFQTVVINYYSKKIAKDIENKVSEMTDGKYMLLINGFKINLLKRSIEISNLAFVPAKGKDSLHNLFILKISSVSLERFSFYTYLTKKKVDFGRLNIDDAEFNIYLKPKSKGEKKVEEKATLNNAHLYIPHVNIVNLKFGLYKGDSLATLILKTEGNIDITDFTFKGNSDSLSAPFSLGSSTIDLHAVEFRSIDKMYTLLAHKLSSSSRDSSIVIDSIRLVPNYQGADFFKRSPDYISMAKLACSKISLIKVDVKKLIEDQILKSSKLVASDIIIDIYRDGNFPITHKIKPSAQAVIRNIPFPILLDTVIIKQAQLNYEELAVGEQAPDKIFLNKINALITGINNDTNSFTAETKLKAGITGYFMGKGLLTTNYSFNMNTRKESFTSEGNLGNMEMQTMNPMFKSSKHLVIKKGMIDTAIFSFSAGAVSAEGKMKLLYHDLIVEPLAKDNENLKNEKIKSFVLNRLIVKENNPGKDNEVRTVNIFIEHDPYRFFPYYIRQALMSGLSNSIIGEKKAELLKKAMK